jgi:hypothetical protein
MPEIVADPPFVLLFSPVFTCFPHFEIVVSQ